MKMSSRLPVALLAATMAFSAVGCKGEPPAPPLLMGQSETAQNGGKISVESFKLIKPDFVDAQGKAQKPQNGEVKVAALRLKVSNPTGSSITYKPLHFNPPERRVQLCTEPDPETGDRTDTPAIRTNEAKKIHTPSQLIKDQVSIPAGGEIYDEYLFDIPMKSGRQLVALIPGEMIGDPSSKVFKFYVGDLQEATAFSPKEINEPVTIDDLMVTVTRASLEYVELVKNPPDSKPLKYPYAYTKQPVLVVALDIKNTGNKERNYQPGHTSQVEGLSLTFDGSPLKRIKLDSKAWAKGQLKGSKSIVAGESLSDIFLFEPPASSGTLNLSISGHIFGVTSGIYKFALDYQKSEPPKPDFEPWKKENVGEGEGGGEEAEPAAE